MSEYKRLTKDEREIVERIKADQKAGRDTVLSWRESHIPMNAILRRAELEDDIENGLRPKLPCKVGDTIYCIEKDCDNSCKYYSCGCCDEMCDHEKYRRLIDKFPNILPCEKMPYIDEYKFTTEFYFSSIGKRYMGITWFLTREQAEAKLKELKGETK